MFRNMTADGKRMIIILAAINFFNYLDRQVIFPLFSHIKAEFSLTDYQLGLLGTAFVLVFSLATVPMGLLADRVSRRFVIAGGVLFWSVATFASGLARSFRSLFFFRSLVGVGEASYNPAASAMMADNYPYQDRARIQGLFYVGAFLGGTIGTIIGGIIVYYTADWRYAFFIVSIPGIILALLSLTLRDKKLANKGASVSLRPLLRNAPYLCLIASGVFSAFAAGAYLSWGVEYVHRYTSYNVRDASLYLGVAMMVAGTLGILLGSHLADVWQRRTPLGRSLLVGSSLILATPFLLAGFSRMGNGGSFFFYFFIGIMLASFYLGPAAAVLHDVTAPAIRASAFAIYLFVTHILGDTFSPALIGKISDISDLRTAMTYATLSLALSGIFFLIGAYYIKQHRSPLWVE